MGYWYGCVWIKCVSASYSIGFLLKLPQLTPRSSLRKGPETNMRRSRKKRPKPSRRREAEKKEMFKWKILTHRNALTYIITIWFWIMCGYCRNIIMPQFCCWLSAELQWTRKMRMCEEAGRFKTLLPVFFLFLVRLVPHWNQFLRKRACSFETLFCYSIVPIN